MQADAGTRRKRTFGLPREHRHLGHLDRLGTAAGQAVLALVKGVEAALVLQHSHSQAGHLEGCPRRHWPQPFSRPTFLQVSIHS